MTPDLRQHPRISHLCVQNSRFCRYRQSGPKTLSFRREMFYLTRTNVFLTFFIKSNPILPFFLWQPRFWDKNPLIWVQNVDFPQNPRNHSKSTSKSGNPSPKTNLTPSFRREYCVLTNVWILWSIYYTKTYYVHLSVTTHGPIYSEMSGVNSSFTITSPSWIKLGEYS